jgi:predicted branched-subunit amino acid permease
VTYVLSVHRYGGKAPASDENVAPLAYFVGLAAVNWSGWNIASFAGVVFATWIPQEWGLCFAGTLALLALIVTLAKDKRTLLMSMLAGISAVALFGLPYRLYIVVAVAAAVACGLMLDEVSKTRANAKGLGS